MCPKSGSFHNPQYSTTRPISVDLVPEIPEGICACAKGFAESKLGHCACATNLRNHPKSLLPSNEGLFTSKQTECRTANPQNPACFVEFLLYYTVLRCVLCCKLCGSYNKIDMDQDCDILPRPPTLGSELKG